MRGRIVKSTAEKHRAVGIPKTCHRFTFLRGTNEFHKRNIPWLCVLWSASYADLLLRPPKTYCTSIKLSSWLAVFFLSHCFEN